jgi:hypothetical protein
MRKLLLPLAAAGLLALTGCVGYGGGTYGAGGVYYDNSPYYGSAPYYGSPYYGYGAGVVIEQRPTYVYGGTTYRRGTRDQDRDGVPNRYDRDRDGDGVSNRRDAYPNDPRRR